MHWACRFSILLILTGCSSDNPVSGPSTTKLVTVDFEVVDSLTNANETIGMAVTRSGVPHVAYKDNCSFHMKHAFRDGDAWHVETMSTDAKDGYGISLGFDPDDQLHATYQRRLTGYTAELRHARLGDQGWEVTVVDRDGYSGVWSSMAFLESNEPFIAYFTGYPVYDLRYAFRESGEWKMSSVDTAGETGYGASLALDADGRRTIAYGSVGKWDLRVATLSDGRWISYMVDRGAWAGPSVTLAIGGGLAHIAYRGGVYPSNYLAYAVGSNSSWATGVIDPDDASKPSIVLDSQGEPWVAYYAKGGARLAYRDGDRWSVISLEVPGRTLLSPRLVATHQGDLYIAAQGGIPPGPPFFGVIRVTNVPISRQIKD